jgi:hypothetical protein
VFECDFIALVGYVQKSNRHVIITLKA